MHCKILEVAASTTIFNIKHVKPQPVESVTVDPESQIYSFNLNGELELLSSDVVSSNLSSTIDLGGLLMEVLVSNIYIKA